MLKIKYFRNFYLIMVDNSIKLKNVNDEDKVIEIDSITEYFRRIGGSSNGINSQVYFNLIK